MRGSERWSVICWQTPEAAVLTKIVFILICCSVIHEKWDYLLSTTSHKFAEIIRAKTYHRFMISDWRSYSTLLLSMCLLHHNYSINPSINRSKNLTKHCRNSSFNIGFRRIRSEICLNKWFHWLHEAVFSIFEWPTILGFIDFDIYL